MPGGIARINCDGSTDQLKGNIVFPCLMGDDAKQVHRPRVIRLLAQDLAVDLFGVFEVAGVLVAKGELEVGGVKLDLRNAAEIESAADALIAAARASHPAARIDGFLVQEMVAGVEAIVGARGDPLYGPILLVGSGGVLVELARDAALRLLPVAAAEVAGMVDSLKLKTLLAGHRGRGAADRPALEAAALALAQFYLDHRARIAEVEINPLMVRAAGRGAVAVDVRVIWKEE